MFSASPYNNAHVTSSAGYSSSKHDDTRHVLNVVVIGAGLIGPRHASHVKQRADCRLFAMVDHSSKGPAVAKSLDTLLFTNLDEMFEYCRANGVAYPHAAIVATPNHTHVPLGLQLANHHVHILMEKPLAPTPAQCKILIDHCRKQNVTLLVGHHRRFNPYIVATKSALPRLGHLVAVQGTWTLSKPASYFEEKPWRSSVEKGGGTLLINLIHDLDLLQYLLGPITKVYAELLTKQRLPKTDAMEQVSIDEGAAGQATDQNMAGAIDQDLVDEGAALTLRFANGCCGTFICSDNVTSPFSFEAGTGENPTIPFNDSIAGLYRIFGSKGSLSVPDLKLYHQENLPPSQRSWLSPVTEESIKMSHEPQHSYADDSMAMAMMDEVSSAPSAPEPNQFDDFGMISPPSSLDSHLQTPIHYPPDSKQFASRQVAAQLEKPKPFDLQLDHFVKLVTGMESVCKCSGDDALRALLVINAVIRSIDTGLPQLVESIDDIKT